MLNSFQIARLKYNGSKSIAEFHEFERNTGWRNRAATFENKIDDRYICGIRGIYKTLFQKS